MHQVGSWCYEQAKIFKTRTSLHSVSICQPFTVRWSSWNLIFSVSLSRNGEVLPSVVHIKLPWSSITAFWIPLVTQHILHLISPSRHHHQHFSVPITEMAKIYLSVAYQIIYDNIVPTNRALFPHKLMIDRLMDEPWWMDSIYKIIVNHREKLSLMLQSWVNHMFFVTPVHIMTLAREMLSQRT